MSETKKEPAYKKWQTWVGVLMPLITLIVGYMINNNNVVTKDCKTYESKILYRDSIISQMDTTIDNYKNLIGKLNYEKNYLKAELKGCEEELEFRTNISRRRPEPSGYENLSDEEKNKVIERALENIQ